MLLILIKQDNTIYKCLIKLCSSSTGQDKSRLNKQISKLLILIGLSCPVIEKYNFIQIFLYCIVLLNSGARCSSMVKVFAHGAMCRRIDPS